MTQRPGQGFEDRLLRELKAVVADDTKGHSIMSKPQRRFSSKRAFALAGAGGVAVIGAVAAVTLPSLLSGTPAYAVEPQDDGTVRVEIMEFENPDEIEDALAEVGIPAQVEFLPEGYTCSLDWFEGSDEAGGNISLDAAAGPEEKGVAFELESDDFKNNDNTLVVELAGDPGTEVTGVMVDTASTVNECEPEPMD